MKRQAGNPTKNGLTILLVPIVLLTLIVSAELILVASKTPDYIVPTPSSVLREFSLDILSGRILRHAAVTISEALLGFFLALIIGIALAIVVNRYQTVHEVIQPYVTAFQAMPKVALAPIIVIWFGFGMESKVVLVTIIAFFIVFVSALNGFQSLSNSVLELMHSYGATEGQILRKARFQNALPFIFAGAEAAVLYSLTAAVVGEFVGSKEGLGYLIQVRTAQMKGDSAFSVILLLVIIALAVQSALTFIKSRLLFWTTKT